jgi:multiple sugar transport system substrate-binding protein
MKKLRAESMAGGGRMPRLWLLVLLSLLLLLVTCCRRKTNSEANAAGGHSTITVWAHHGKPEEWKTIQEQVKRFNRTQTNVTANLVEIAEANYDTQVQSAAATGHLPDVMEFDGPMLANYAWKGYLKPLGGLGAEVRTDLLPSIVQQGTYRGRLYAVGAFDSGPGLFADRRLLEQVGARVPTNVAGAWTLVEFNTMLAALAGNEKRSGGDGQVLDLKRDCRGEWWTYGFYASLVSAGADLLDRDPDYPPATT